MGFCINNNYISKSFSFFFLFSFCFSSSQILCSISSSTVVFFAYPGVGFNNKYILFENLYSIATHSLAFCMSLLIITLGFAKFEIKNCWKEALCFLGLLCYVLLEIFVLKIEDDPMYFMPGNDIVEILNVGYGWFVFLYILVLLVYFACFYLIGDRKTIFRKKENCTFV